MSTRYSKAPAVERIGRELIAEHHRHLTNTRVEYLFIDKTPTRSGKEIWGTARRISSLAAFLADDGEEGEPFFCITISSPVWNTLTEEKRRALVDHELSHCWIEEKEDGSQSLVLLSHDLEEFAAVVLRHGLYREEVAQFHDVAVQAAQRSLYEMDGGETQPKRVQAA